MFMLFEADTRESDTIVWGNETLGTSTWEDIVDDHGEPEQIAPGVWTIRAERDRPIRNEKHGDPVLLIIQTLL